MSGDFAKYAKGKYGYDATFTYTDSPFSTLFQKAAASLATRSAEFNIIISDSQWPGAFAEPKWIVDLTDLVTKDPQFSKVEWYDPTVVSTYMAYPRRFQELRRDVAGGRRGGLALDAGDEFL